MPFFRIEWAPSACGKTRSWLNGIDSCKTGARPREINQMNETTDEKPIHENQCRLCARRQSRPRRIITLRPSLLVQRAPINEEACFEVTMVGVDKWSAKWDQFFPRNYFSILREILSCFSIRIINIKKSLF